MSEPPQVHTCIVCGKRAHWGDTWSWYGSILEAETDPSTIECVCSAACRKQHKPKPRRSRDKVVPPWDEDE